MIICSDRYRYCISYFPPLALGPIAEYFSMIINDVKVNDESITTNNNVTILSKIKLKTKNLEMSKHTR